MLEQYWQQEGFIREILYSTLRNQLIVPIHMVDLSFHGILSTLVYISATEVSYIRHLHRYISSCLNDLALSHLKKPQFLSDARDDLEFFEAFREPQWMCCCTNLGPKKLYKHRLDSRQILPFVNVENEGSTAQIGRKTKIRCVQVGSSGGLQLPNWVCAFLILIPVAHLLQYLPRRRYTMGIVTVAMILQLLSRSPLGCYFAVHYCPDYWRTTVIFLPRNMQLLHSHTSILALIVDEHLCIQNGCQSLS